MELGVVWDEATGAYRRPSDRVQVTSGSTRPRRLSTHPGSRRPARDIDPRVAEARQFEERLRYALRDGAFLVLTVRPSQMLACERELALRFPELERLSLDRLLLERLRSRAAEDEVDWRVIREADGAPPGSDDHRHLCDMVAEIIPAVEAGLLSRGHPVLLVHPGLLARYDQMDLLTRLRDRVGRKGACPGLWVLVAADEQSELPLIDGREVPLIGSGQRARAPLAWMENLHRATRAATAP